MALPFFVHGIQTFPAYGSFSQKRIPARTEKSALGKTSWKKWNHRLPRRAGIAYYNVCEKKTAVIMRSKTYENNENENEMVFVPLLRFGNFRPAVRHDGNLGGKEQNDQ